MCTCPPVSAASRMSRPAVLASATPGMPRKPSEAATGPSCAQPSALSDGSSQCSIIGMSNMLVYSSARRARMAVATGTPSSVTATQPASFNSAMSASSSPFCPRETAPIGYTRASPASAAFCKISFVTPALSLTGLVLGMHATAVNPPATAAATPVATVSLCSCPGSRKCTCISMKPGHTINPFGMSTTVAPLALMLLPTSAMRSPSIRTSKIPSRPLAGSTTRPPLRRRFMLCATRQQIQHRHPYRDAVRYLIENYRGFAVCHLRRDLDTAIDRTGMHDDHIGLRALDARLSHAERREVLPQRRKVAALHPFQLDAQHHDYVRTFHGFIDPGRNAHTHLLQSRRNQRRRRAHPHLGAQLRQQQQVGT